MLLACAPFFSDILRAWFASERENGIKTAPFVYHASSSSRRSPLPPSTMPSPWISKPPKSSTSPNPNTNSLLCRHSPSATLDVLILILVLFSGAFLLTSYFSYIFNSLSILFSNSHFHPHQFPFPYVLGFFVFFGLFIGLLEVCCGARSRRCEEPGCKGLKRAMEFDLQLQTEECVKTGSKDIDKLPWKGGSEANPHYECLRSELRKMAPPNGRAILLFRARCGCPVSKLEGWGTKRGRRHKKALATMSHRGIGGRDYR